MGLYTHMVMADCVRFIIDVAGVATALEGVSVQGYYPFTKN